MREPLSIRIDEKVMARLKAASNAGLYAPSMTEIVERGIILALRELERKRK